MVVEGNGGRGFGCVVRIFDWFVKCWVFMGVGVMFVEKVWGKEEGWLVGVCLKEEG